MSSSVSASNSLEKNMPPTTQAAHQDPSHVVIGAARANTPPASIVAPPANAAPQPWGLYNTARNFLWGITDNTPQPAAAAVETPDKPLTVIESDISHHGVTVQQRAVIDLPQKMETVQSIPIPASIRSISSGSGSTMTLVDPSPLHHRSSSSSKFSEKLKKISRSSSQKNVTAHAARFDPGIIPPHQQSLPPAQTNAPSQLSHKVTRGFPQNLEQKPIPGSGGPSKFPDAPVAVSQVSPGASPPVALKPSLITNAMNGSIQWFGRNKLSNEVFVRTGVKPKIGNVTSRVEHDRCIIQATQIEMIIPRPNAASFKIVIEQADLTIDSNVLKINSLWNDTQDALKHIALHDVRFTMHDVLAVKLPKAAGAPIPAVPFSVSNATIALPASTQVSQISLRNVQGEYNRDNKLALAADCSVLDINGHVRINTQSLIEPQPSFEIDIKRLENAKIAGMTINSAKFTRDQNKTQLQAEAAVAGIPFKANFEGPPQLLLAIKDLVAKFGLSTAKDAIAV